MSSKIRQGFVSNSSSSSFIISGDIISFEDVPKFPNCILVTNDEVFGDGCDKIELTHEIYEYIKENKSELRLNLNECEIITNPKFHDREWVEERDYFGYGCGSRETEPISGIERDISYHATKNSLEELKQRYLKGDDDE